MVEGFGKNLAKWFWLGISQGVAVKMSARAAELLELDWKIFSQEGFPAWLPSIGESVAAYGKRSLFPTTWASPRASQVSSWRGSSFLQSEWWSRRDQSQATVSFMSLGSLTQSSPWRSLGHSSQLYSVGMPAQRQTYRVSENLWEPSWMMIIPNTIYYNTKNRAFKCRNKHKVYERFCAENCKALPREIEEFLKKWKNMLC